MINWPTAIPAALAGACLAALLAKAITTDHHRKAGRHEPAHHPTPPTAT